jgi:hypothetical protein
MLIVNVLNKYKWRRIDESTKEETERGIKSGIVRIDSRYIQTHCHTNRLGDYLTVGIIKCRACKTVIRKPI